MSRVGRRLGSEFDMTEDTVDNSPSRFSYTECESEDGDLGLPGFVPNNNTFTGQTNGSAEPTNYSSQSKRRSKDGCHSSHESLNAMDNSNRERHLSNTQQSSSNDTLVTPSELQDDKAEESLSTDLTPIERKSSQIQIYSTEHAMTTATASEAETNNDSPPAELSIMEQGLSSSQNGSKRGSLRSSDSEGPAYRNTNGSAGLNMDFGQMKVTLTMNDDDDDDYELDLTISRIPPPEIPSYTEVPPPSTVLHNINEGNSDGMEWVRSSDIPQFGYSGRRTPTNGQLSDSSGRHSFESASPPGLSRVSSSGKLTTDRKKKPYWYNVLSPTYKSRSEDFKRIFKDIPGEERMIVDYSCALQKDILVHGRIYITQNYICFYANIFRWETVLMLRCKDITSMTKEKTARVIPNAIQICTKDDKYFFTSFGTRDKTYLMLFRVWQNALAENPMSAQELWQWVHYSYGEELGLNSSDEDYVQPTMEDEHMFQTRVQHEESMVAAMEGAGICDKEDPDSLNVPLTNGDLADKQTEAVDEVQPDGARTPAIKVLTVENAGLEDVTDLGDTTEDDDDEVQCTGHEHLDIDVIDRSYNFSVDKLFEMLFTDSQVYRHFTEVKKTTELVQSQWSEEIDAQGDRHRVISYTLSLNYSIGPKTSPATEKQMLRSDSKPGAFYLVDTECINGSIPYGDNFYVVNRYCLNRVNHNMCRLKITSSIRYRKSVWGLVKNFIEKNVQNGITDSFTCLADLLQQESIRLGQQAIIAPPAGKKKVLRRRRNVSDRTQTIKRIDQQAARQSTPVKSHILKSQASHPGRVEEEAPSAITADVLVRVICAVLVILAIFNGLLYYKLWSLEQHASMMQQKPDILKNIKEQPQSQDEWLRLIEQQQTLHDTEIERWKDVLATSVKLMHNMQSTLQALERGINTKYPSHLDKDGSSPHDEH